MKSNSDISKRKSDHLEINFRENVTSSNTSGLEKFRLTHCALPEINFASVNTSTELFNKTLSVPLLISSMTGGTDKAMKINRLLAQTAQKHQLAMGVGSQRIGIEDPKRMKTFEIRKYAPDILLFSNLGAIQLNYSFSVDECERAVKEIDANALILHLNPLQEVLMEDGNADFSGLLKKIETVCQKLTVPVIVKEVGWGISVQIARKLVGVGVKAIDVAGAGGTSWSEVEKFRASDPIRKRIAESLSDWGIPTAEALVGIREKFPDLILFASGGIKNGIDIVKCLALGADLCGIARNFFLAAMKSEQELESYITEISKQIKIAMFAIGADSIASISREKISFIG